MNKTTLVVMAAGLGSRYGGNKQIEGLGPNNEIIMDYSIYDAIAAGFNKIVFIIKKEMHATFHQIIGERIAKLAEVAYAFQDFDSIPSFYKIPQERTKPFGTVHAVLCTAHVVSEPFCVINADDYYGPESFKSMHTYLTTIKRASQAPYEFSLVGYELQNTISDFGTVTRGVCAINDANMLDKIVETYQIKRFPDGTIRDIHFHDEGDILAPKTPVSMNFWGFSPEIFPLFQQYFDAFLKKLTAADIKKEYGLPTCVQDLIADNLCTLKVLPCVSKWFGVTYQEDKANVMACLNTLHDSGVYPPSLIDKP